MKNRLSTSWLLTLGLVLCAIGPRVRTQGNLPIGKHPRPATREELEILKHLSLEQIEHGTDAQHPGFLTVRVTGLDVQIVNGAGDTLQANGLGNLIIGYAEVDESASHSIVMGTDPYVDGAASLVAGTSNTVNASHAMAIAGFGSTVEAQGAVITGGVNSLITSSADNAVVTGGDQADVEGDRAVHLGGRYTRVDGPDSVVTGGYGGWARLYTGAIVSGGQESTSEGPQSAVAGGYRVQAAGGGAFIGGGSTGWIGPGNDYAAIIGGLRARARGTTSVTIGGQDCVAEGWRSVAIGGYENLAFGQQCVATGGNNNVVGDCFDNWITGEQECDYNMTVHGGRSNTAKSSLFNQTVHGLSLSGGYDRDVTGVCFVGFEVTWRAGGTYSCNFGGI